MNWDEVVDVVCIEAGPSGLASAIATVDGGADVFVASSTRVDGAPLVKVGPRSKRLPHWLGMEVSDLETLEYFAALSAGLALDRWAGDVDVPVSVVADPSPEPISRAVEPFIGARLTDWAARCLTSPYGWLYTRVTGPHTTTMRTRDGDTIEVVEVSTFEPGALEFNGSALADWLTTQARERGIEVHTASPLQRIVFEDGQVVGAVVSTPDGPYAVRARHGVSVAPSGPQVDIATRHELLGSDATARLCLVSRKASRFGRLELLTTESGVHRPPCRCTSRHLHIGLHETRQLPSQPWRCGKVHGYPPLGQ